MWVGIRVVCAYEAELAKVAEIVEVNFDVRERIDKGRELGVDRMGYNGKAFVVMLGTDYSGGRYENITALSCEIQVRTILQDAWAIIDHQLVYKNEKSTPERLRRDLNNVASLLEIAQGIFDSVKEKRTAYVSEIQQKEKDPPNFLAQPLDFDTVIAYTRWKFPDRDASEKLTDWFKTGTDFLTKSLGFVDSKFRAKHGFAPRTRAAFDTFQKLVAE
jgi:putative GTP pyrophosphokinase